MIALLTLAVLAQSDYEGRARAADDAVADERLKAGEALEGIQAWRFARVQYRLARAVPSAQDAAQARIDGLRAKSTENEAFSSAKAAKVQDLLASIGKLAAARHRELAQWCASHDLPAEAKRHWSRVLQYDPAQAEAITALGLSGAGAAAIDPAWKDVKFAALLADADAGKADLTPSDVAKKWKTKTQRRVASKGAVELEGVDVSQERLTRLAKVASADLAFWRIALGEPELVPPAKRLVILTGLKNYERYIDDFYDADDREKKESKESGGIIIPKRGEFVTYGDTRKDAGVEFSIAEYYSYFILNFELPPWLSVAVGSLPQKLLLGRVESFSFEPAEGTDQLDKDKMFADEKKFQDAVRDLVLQGRDSDLDQLASTKYNAMTRPQIAKSMSLLRFLVMRWPGVFRNVVAAYRQGAGDQRADLEKVFGCTLEELDEHWRRWVLAAK